MTDETNYQIPLYSAILLHIIILGILVLSFKSSTPPPVLQNSDTVIQAMVLSEEIKPPSKVVQQPRISKPIAKPEVAKEKPTPPPPAKPDALAIAEKKQKEELLQKKLLADLKKETERKKKLQEKAVQTAMEKEIQEMNDKVLREEMLQEQKRLATVRTMQMQGIVDKYKALILHAIGQNWLVPPQVNRKLYAELLIRLAPGGVVLNVQVTKSSGDPSLDRSAEAAVLKASPLPVPSKAEEFEAFRQFELRVKPENIVTL